MAKKDELGTFENKTVSEGWGIRLEEKLQFHHERITRLEDGREADRVQYLRLVEGIRADISNLADKMERRYDSIDEQNKIYSSVVDRMGGVLADVKKYLPQLEAMKPAMEQLLENIMELKKWGKDIDNRLDSLEKKEEYRRGIKDTLQEKKKRFWEKKTFWIPTIISVVSIVSAILIVVL